MTPTLAIFASGSGTNAAAIFKHFKNHPSIKVGLLLTNNPAAAVLDKAKKFGITSIVFAKSQFSESDEVVELLRSHQITHLVLAGFLLLIPKNLIAAYPNKIINIHPALLPKFGGKGMYGMKVHEAVKAANEKETGITVHAVNEKYDEGKIIFQATCEVALTDTPQQIAQKVHLLEHENYPTVIEEWVCSKIDGKSENNRGDKSVEGIKFQIVQPTDTKNIELIANWYLSEWDIPVDKTIQRLKTITCDNFQAQVLMTLDGIPITTGGLYNQVGLTDKEPRFRIYKNWLAQVYTIPNRRHQGFGELICGYIQDYSKKMGVKEMYLFTDTAENLYKRLGWYPVERLPLGERKVVVMKKKL
jgi:phosphoribosylglycinamide formyltransferase 1